MITNIVIILLILAAVIPALLYLYRAKKKGQPCVGCPYCNSCGKNCCTRSEA